MASRLRFGVLAVALVTAALSASCNLRRLERQLVSSRQLTTTDKESPYLKAHLKNGSVYVLSDWHADSSAAVIVGSGQLLDVNRTVVDSGRFRVPVDSVSLFETNVLHSSGATTALTVMAGITAGVAVVCLTNTKACFGSCPTFYADDELVAEGFSASIAPALEATDLDMLVRARPRGRDFTLRLTNEALETHVIRWADLIVAPRPSGGRVFVTPDGVFRNATALAAPARCTAAEGDCLPAVMRLDGQERSSTTDSTDLATRETIELEFAPSDSGARGVGVVITARQSLLTTFLIYQSLAYMGHDAGRFLAALSTMGANARTQAGGLGRTLGRIDVLVPGDTGWIVTGSVGETGPLAADTKVVPLPGTGAQRVRLRMTKGLWRIDYVALARLGGGDPVATERLLPARVRRDGQDDPAALRALRDSARVLTTLPGDKYELTYRLPPHPERYELFLEARGYYIEWMRREWFAEQNSGLALGMFLDPAGALKRLAPAYKKVEPDIERVFWNSRYAKP